VKLGDSLGRSRRRRKKPGASEAEPAGDAAPQGEQGEQGADSKPSTADGDDIFAPRTSLGSETKESRGWGALGKLRVRDLALVAVGLALLGWVVGYGIATRIVFPAPPPPGDLFEVPDLRGLGVASAGERLAGAGLQLGSVDSLQHPSVATGLVLGQSPLPGQVSPPDQPVNVTVSAGPQMRSIPDVRRLDRERARVVLETSGFVVDIDTAEAEEPRGRVIDLVPPPDSVVALPAEVRLVVSTGPPVVTMPLVLGLEQGEAEMLLDSLGLVVTDVEEVFRFGRDQGIVVEQQPAADTELERGSSVQLKVGRRGLGREQ
jgi:beta-lactam-binding protein with PASTA domain